MLADLLTALQASEAATALRKSFWVYPLVNAGHIFGLAMIFGAILPMDLRLLGFWPKTDYRLLAKILLPVAITGILLAIATGIALFSARPLDYAYKPLFQIKIAIIILVLINALLLHHTRAWKNSLTGNQGSIRLRVSGIISIAGWASIIILGRFLGYY
tara:strand:+ start:2387 stop:2863 length:477 start_codon:yes stop_codon:yes gene_type:complete